MTRAEWLAGLCQTYRWTRGVEVGVKRGETIEVILDACPAMSMIGVDLWEPSPGYEGWPHAEHERDARERLSRFGDRVELVKADSVSATIMVADASADFVFIDGDHSTLQVMADIEAWYPKLKPGGALCGHDVNWRSVRLALDNALPGWKEVPHDRCWISG